MPFPGRDKFDLRDSVKIQALQSMVAEKLLAIEAETRGLGLDSMTQLRLNGLERAFVRDELYKKEIAAKVSVSPREIADGMKKYAMQLQLLVFRCPTEGEARRISESLQHRRSSAEDPRPPASVMTKIIPDTAIVDFGGWEESLENVAYALDAAHPASGAVRSGSIGWVVLYLVDGHTNPTFEKESIGGREISVKNIIRDRKAQLRGIRYMASVLDRQKAEANPRVLEVLGKALYAILTSDTTLHKTNGQFYLMPGEVDRLEGMLRRELSSSLVEMPGGLLTLGMAVQSLRIEPFSTPSLGHREFAYVVNETVRRIVQEELLTRRGMTEQLQNSPDVKRDLGAWRDNWLSQMVEAEIPHSEPTEEEEIAGLIENARFLSPLYEVNVREIFTDSISTAERLRDSVLAGADMAKLATKYSKRSGWAERGGESEYFHVRSFPELGIRSLMADTGILVGPAHVTGGYSIFMVLGKHLASGDSIVTLDSLRGAIHEYVRTEKRQRETDRVIAGLAQKYGVRAFYSRLKDIEIFGHNMFTRRLIGFGGRMNAAPLLKPETRWVREYHRAKDMVP